MNDTRLHSNRRMLRQLRAILSRQFSVRGDQAEYEVIDATIRSMGEFSGTNLWVLMFAIVVASIGLNVNSAAVIIGAMLISPLMGPIMGIGYGIGINDFDLIKKSARNISLAVLISIFSATLYFLISPLSEARSELLSRTTPTIWDVLIALFGGLAGILATTRKEKSTVIPGVAIATALMPPLCTAGYGLATAHWSYFFGAFYLFFINMVFIALATVLFIGYLKPPHKRFVDAATERRVRTYIISLVLITVLPSIYLAYDMVTDVAFNSRAHAFIKNQMAFENTLVTQEIINPTTKEIEVSLIGDEISNEQLNSIKQHLTEYRLENVHLVVHQPSSNKIDIASLKTSLLKDLYTARLKSGEEKDRHLQELEAEISQIKAAQPDTESIEKELQIQFATVERLALANTRIWQTNGSNENVLIAYLVVGKHMSRRDQKKIIDWLKIRTKTETVRLVVVRS
ncbi:MAG: TIGR00341 family protein [Gallionella sp.]|jgi:uncharacterized hydrophobic protein (TIGR00271 family)